MKKVIKVAKNGKDAETSTDPNDFIFHSDYNTFKIIATGTTSFVLNADVFEVQYFTVAHNLDYTPFVFAFCKFPDGRVGVVGDNQANSNLWFATLEVDATNITFGFANSVGTPTVYVRYFITEAPL
jgi:hypothetical protein